MIIGVPRECMAGEFRVALTPADCAGLVDAGCRILIEQGAGNGSGFSDDDYTDAGCSIAADKAGLYGGAELIVKVKQPLAADLKHLQAQHTVFSYFHLAADPALISALLDIGLTAIPFESVTDDGRLPLLAPMSAIAGRVATIRGAGMLFRHQGGSGTLLGGSSPGDARNADSGRVVVLGAGVAGTHAAVAAAALGAAVTVLDLDETRLKQLRQAHPSIDTSLSTTVSIDHFCAAADLVIGAVLVAGRRAPVVLRRTTIARMRPGSVIIDIAIDQGGCIEGIEMTAADEPAYARDGILYSAVPNMPATVARTASQALSASIRGHVAGLAGGEDTAVIERAVAIRGGEIVDGVLAEEYARRA